MDKLLSPFRQSKTLNTLFLSNIFFSFHYFLIYYVNSSFLATRFSETQVSALYVIGSIIDACILINSSKIINKIGTYKFTVYGIVIEFLATAGMIVANTPFLMALYFLIHLVTISTLLFNLDVLLESVSTDESKTGSIRATYLTITNIVVVLSPSIVAVLLIHNVYAYVYALSTAFLVPLYFYIQKFKHVSDTRVPPIRIRETLSVYLKNKDLYNIFSAQFLLQFFYAFMGIYMALYLERNIGFSWSEIGIIFTIMLLPFVFTELPIGELADKKYGEKEFLTIGFIIMGISTLCISFITTKSFFMWASILFITRVGASFVEITSDSYFFKHVDEKKTDIISFYRITRPLSFIIAPLLATLCLQFIPFQYTFIVLGAFMILGVRYSLALTDTK